MQLTSELAGPTGEFVLCLAAGIGLFLFHSLLDRLFRLQEVNAEQSMERRDPCRRNQQEQVCP